MVGSDCTFCLSEHGPNGVSIVAGCTMDNQIAFDVLSNALLAARIIGDSKACCDSLQSLISQLPPMQIGQYNQLQEWLEDVDDPKTSIVIYLICMDCIK